MPARTASSAARTCALSASTNVFGLDPTTRTARTTSRRLDEMHVPVNKPVICYISSKDVIHSFKIIAMRVTQDAIPGMRIPIWFTPDAGGPLPDQLRPALRQRPFRHGPACLVVESQAAFDKWLASKAAPPPASNKRVSVCV